MNITRVVSFVKVKFYGSVKVPGHFECSQSMTHSLPSLGAGGLSLGQKDDDYNGLIL